MGCLLGVIGQGIGGTYNSQLCMKVECGPCSVYELCSYVYMCLHCPVCVYVHSVCACMNGYGFVCQCVCVCVCTCYLNNKVHCH